MRFLLSFVNSSLALAGFDWDSGELFWELPAERLRTCGICYDGDSLLVVSDDELHRYSPTSHASVRLPGPYPSLAHSVHCVGQDLIGIADTGNSSVRLFSRAGQHVRDLCPIAAWPKVPPDAIHLNDFVVTPQGIIASCFDVRPWRTVQELYSDRNAWCTAGLGVLLSLTDGGETGRVIACGLNHPHTLIYAPPDVYHCSSATGTFHRFAFTESGTLAPVSAINITRDHFLRGACLRDGAWYLGGSTFRYRPGACDKAAMYRLSDQDGAIERKTLPVGGDLYDILPWRDEILRPLLRLHFGSAIVTAPANSAGPQCCVAAGA